MYKSFKKTIKKMTLSESARYRMGLHTQRRLRLCVKIFMIPSLFILYWMTFHTKGDVWPMADGNENANADEQSVIVLAGDYSSIVEEAEPAKNDYVALNHHRNILLPIEPSDSETDQAGAAAGNGGGASKEFDIDKELLRLNEQNSKGDEKNPDERGRPYQPAAKPAVEEQVLQIDEEGNNEKERHVNIVKDSSVKEEFDHDKELLRLNEQIAEKVLLRHNDDQEEGDAVLASQGKESLPLSQQKDSSPQQEAFDIDKELLRLNDQGGKKKADQKPDVPIEKLGSGKLHVNEQKIRVKSAVHYAIKKEDQPLDADKKILRLHSKDSSMVEVEEAPRNQRSWH